MSESPKTNLRPATKIVNLFVSFVWVWLALMMLVLLFWFASCVMKYARAERITSADLEYLGAFQAPPWTSKTWGPDKRPARFGYGMSSIAYNPALGTLFATGHPHGDLVAEITIPAPSTSKPYARALMVQEFGDVSGSLYSKIRESKLDSIGGLEVIGERLYWSFYTYYAVGNFASLDVPSFGRSRLDLSDPRAEGLWKVGPYGNPVFGQKRTSRYMTEIPDQWARDHSPGRRLAVGKGDGAGNAGNSLGPPLFAVAIPTGPVEVLDATVLVHYDAEKRYPGWSPCDQWTGVVWIDQGDRAAVIFAGRRGLGEADYGTPAEVSERQGRQSCGSGKGYHCDPYGVELAFYDPDDLAKSAHGEIEPHDVMPYDRFNVDLPDQHCAKSIGGLAYNEDRGEIYLVEENRENPIVHVWKVGKHNPPPKEEPKDMITLMDVKLEAFSSLATALLLEGASPEDLVAAIEMAKMKAEDWKQNEQFESISADTEDHP